MNKITIIDKAIKYTFLWFIPMKVQPNHVTIFRFLTIPFVIYFIVLENYVIGIPLFVISAFSDAIDGAMARTRDQITEWGSTFDPVADKLLIGSLAAILVSKEIDPILAFVIIFLEVLIVMSAIYKKKKYQSPIEAKKAGKAKMIFQSFGIGFLLLFLAVSAPWMFLLAKSLLYVSVVFALLSLFVYKSA
ncbi:MAG: CDP-diacylglycerol--glycerol-3-phosphate 3-phosphatidyltransferase [Candidatus Paceibacteria bacterium]|jgi:CDP-diacylglycerol--glycerol-3-phosphate 3-phosphatidyltransferase